VVAYLPFALWLGLLFYCLVDIDRTPPGAARRLSEGWWLVLVVVLPIAGAVAWLVLGRPAPVSAIPRAVASRTVGVDMRTAPAAADGEGSGPVPPTVVPDPQSAIDENLRAELARIDREFDELVSRSRERRAE
jgi:hypothetical protein